MWYNVSLEIPANTDRNDRVRRYFKVFRGVIHTIRITVPRGSAGLVKCRLLHGEHPLSPSTDGQWFGGDGEPFEYRDFKELTEEINELTIEAYNDDDTYPHTVTFGIGILPKDVLLPSFSTEGIIAAMRSLFTRGRQ